MQLSVTTRPRYSPPVEFVERKGTGHPDTICDSLAESLGRRLAQGFVAHTGAVQHFNVDKAVLAAGAVEVAYGGGTHLRPSRVVLVGKADLARWSPDPEELLAASRGDLTELLPDARPEAFELEIWISPSSSDLAGLVSGRNGDAPLCNDTSFAVVSLPRSPLEEAVHEVERHLNSPAFRAVVPAGRDIKVMGSRLEGRSELTVAAAILAERVGGPSEYKEAVEAIRHAAAAVASEAVHGPVTVTVNQADAADAPYLTLSGTSAEAGDDGQVGRGNRFGGLITPYRPMSLEACAGKNPAAHVGKTYHATAYDIATRILAETPATETTVRLLSRIGNPVTQPQVVHVETDSPISEGAAEAVVADCLADWAGVTARLVAGSYELF